MPSACSPSPRASMMLSGRGPEQQSKGSDTVLALINLMLALGKVGKPYSGYGCLTGQGNGQGGREHGQKADQLPGYRLIEDPEDRAGDCRASGASTPTICPGKGKSAYELLDALGPEGGIRALLVFGSNVAVASPNAANIEKKLRDARPPRRVRRVRERDDRGSARRPARHAMGRGRGHDDEPGGARDPPPARSSAATGLQDRSRDPLRARAAARREPGLSVRVRGGGVRRAARRHGRRPRRLQRHHLREDPPRARRVLALPQRRPSRDAAPLRRHASLIRAVARASTPCPIAPPPRCRTPSTRSTSRRAATRSTTTRARRRAASRRSSRPGPSRGCKSTRGLPRRLGVADGEGLVVESRRGTVCFSVLISSDIRADTLFAPFHWGGRSAANMLTIPALDPISRMPEFKVCAVRARAAEPALENAGRA